MHDAAVAPRPSVSEAALQLLGTQSEALGLVEQVLLKVEGPSPAQETAKSPAESPDCITRAVHTAGAQAQALLSRLHRLSELL